jgi:Npun R1517
MLLLKEFGYRHMQSDSFNYPTPIKVAATKVSSMVVPVKPHEGHGPAIEVGVYECEVHLKFRLVEEKGVLLDREQLLEMLIDAYLSGSDEYMEPLQSKVDVQEMDETNASPQMRRQLMRLRNSRDLN